MNAPCATCGAIDTTSPCPVHWEMAVGSCPQYYQSQLRKMDALEVAWDIVKGKEDAPNYRKATGPQKCGNCKAWDSSKTDDPMTGYCEWYDFTCRADHVCDAWAGKK